MNKLNQYKTTAVQSLFAERPDPKSLSDQDLFFLVRNQRVLGNRPVWQTYMDELNSRISEYNGDGSEYKTPFPLRNIPPGTERDLILISITSLDDSFLCPGAGEWGESLVISH